MACEARSGLKLLSVWHRLVDVHMVGMACEARSGLKLLSRSRICSAVVVGMACEARSGLKLISAIDSILHLHGVGMACEARSGLKLIICYVSCTDYTTLGWPVKPVRD